MIELRDVTFAYPKGEFRLQVPALRVAEGERAVISGPSGCGKTTLLHLAGGILVPHAGVVSTGQQELSRQSDAARRRFRLREVGIVFQEFELLEYLTARENIFLPLRGSGLRVDREVQSHMHELVEAAGIAALLDRYPRKLSHGQRQRVAVCRALITRPRIVLADEPTGSLDRKSGTEVIELILQQSRLVGATVLAVTHDHGLQDRFDRVIDCEAFSC